ncbi:hypothetical protein B0H10DRAFT_1942294 [Mycena sp. CBHHK59/15]|nr:hypothetical protein B0H10DRAFT_1942294 [Mycena sp. CBHHK59/15]
MAMFIITLFMYILSAAYWVYSVADVVDRMQVFINTPVDRLAFIPDHDQVTKWSPLANALTLINYVLSDGVVVWRAWVICLRKHRKYLWITIVFLVLTALTVVVTIGFRIAAFVESPIANLPKGSFLNTAVDIVQIATLIMSLASNLSATGVVAATAWQHRQTLRAAFADGKKTKADHILGLVVESGVLYCVSAMTVLLSSLIRLPHGTLGDIYTPVNVQIAGAYPPVVLLLVSLQKSLSETTFSDTLASSSMPSHGMRSESSGNNTFDRNRSAVGVQFGRNPALSMSDRDSMDSFRNNSLEKSRQPNRFTVDSFA